MSAFFRSVAYIKSVPLCILSSCFDACLSRSLKRCFGVCIAVYVEADDFADFSDACLVESFNSVMFCGIVLHARLATHRCDIDEKCFYQPPTSSSFDLLSRITVEMSTRLLAFDVVRALQDCSTFGGTMEHTLDTFSPGSQVPGDCFRSHETVHDTG